MDNSKLIDFTRNSDKMKINSTDAAAAAEEIRLEIFQIQLVDFHLLILLNVKQRNKNKILYARDKMSCSLARTPRGICGIFIHMRIGSPQKQQINPQLHGSTEQKSGIRILHRCVCAYIIGMAWNRIVKLKNKRRKQKYIILFMHIY